MDTSLDNRAGAAAVLAIFAASLTAFYPVLAILSSTFGLIFGIASVVAVDEPATNRTRWIALGSCLILGICLAISLGIILTAPQSGE